MHWEFQRRSKYCKRVQAVERKHFEQNACCWQAFFLFWCNLQRGHAVSSEWEINIVLWCKDDVFRDFLSLCGMAKQIKKEGSSILWNKICYSTFFHHITLSHTESVSLVCSLDPFFFYFHSYRVPYQITSLSKFAQCSILVMSKFALLYWFSSVLAITNYTVPT